VDLHDAAAFIAPSQSYEEEDRIHRLDRPDVWIRNRYVERLLHQVSLEGGEPALRVKYDMQCVPNTRLPDCQNCIVCDTTLKIGNLDGPGFPFSCADQGRTFVHAEISPLPDRTVQAITYRRMTRNNARPSLPGVMPPYPDE
jgi:hypothetical protein